MPSVLLNILAARSFILSQPIQFSIPYPRKEASQASSIFWCKMQISLLCHQLKVLHIWYTPHRGEMRLVVCLPCAKKWGKERAGVECPLAGRILKHKLKLNFCKFFLKNNFHQRCLNLFLSKYYNRIQLHHFGLSHNPPSQLSSSFIEPVFSLLSKLSLLFFLLFLLNSLCPW